MDLFAEIADERRRLAEQLSGLTPEQQAAPSLCDRWTVHDVAAHLIMPMEVRLPRFALALLAARGDFDRANVRLTDRVARRPFGEVVDVLRRKADVRFTPPGAGPESPLTDVLVHGLDICRPLGISRDVPAARLRTALTFLGTPQARGVARAGVVGAHRWEADDVGWAHGDGPLVRGPAQALLLAITGRPAALAELDGDGVAALRDRLTAGAPA